MQKSSLSINKMSVIFAPQWHTSAPAVWNRGWHRLFDLSEGSRCELPPHNLMKHRELCIETSMFGNRFWKFLLLNLCLGWRENILFSSLVIILLRKRGWWVLFYPLVSVFELKAIRDAQSAIPDYFCQGRDMSNSPDNLQLLLVGFASMAWSTASESTFCQYRKTFNILITIIITIVLDVYLK